MVARGARVRTIQVEVEAHAFPRPPFQGARAPREMAQKMRDNAKAAVALLESGDLARWFASNGWNYPVSGQPAKGDACVATMVFGAAPEAASISSKITWQSMLR